MAIKGIKVLRSGKAVRVIRVTNHPFHHPSIRPHSSSIHQQSSQHTDYGFQFYIDPIDGSDVADGMSAETAWKTVARSNSQDLTGNQKIGYKFSGVWILYRTPDMTVDLGELSADLVDTETDSF